MAWKIRILPDAERDLNRIPHKLRGTILQEIIELEEDPFPEGSIEMRKTNNVFRIRVSGNYRTVYTVARGRREVLIERVQPRSVVYKGYDRR